MFHKKSLIVKDNVFFLKRCLNIRDNETFDELATLWRSERLLTQSKEPLKSLRSGSTFMDSMLLYAQKMKVRLLFLSIIYYNI